MRVAILTNSLHGTASVCLARLAAEPSVKVALIILSEEQPADRGRLLRKKLSKALKVGLFGALNGIRMRSWFALEPRPESLEKLAANLGIRFERTPRVNCDRTRQLFREADVDLGLSLGNSYIGRSVFTIPRKGMINIHHELLPEFQGAQSIVWQIHEGSRDTGFTIHQVDEHIDTGNILLREKRAIEFKKTLRETVRHNVNRLCRASAEGLAEVVRGYDQYSSASTPQGRGKSFTTPTLRQYMKMVSQHERLRRELQ